MVAYVRDDCAAAYIDPLHRIEPEGGAEEDVDMMSESDATVGVTYNHSTGWPSSQTAQVDDENEIELKSLTD